MEEYKNLTIALWIMLISVIFSVVITAVIVTKIIQQDIIQQDIIQQRNEITQKDELDLYIDKLADYECTNCPENFRIIDSNGKYSYGCLQFQESTFIAKVKDYNLLPSAEDGEIINLIYACDFQKRLAKLMFQNEKDTYKHWYTSVEIRGLGRPPVDK